TEISEQSVAPISIETPYRELVTEALVSDVLEDDFQIILGRASIAELESRGLPPPIACLNAVTRSQTLKQAELKPITCSPELEISPPQEEDPAVESDNQPVEVTVDEPILTPLNVEDVSVLSHSDPEFLKLIKMSGGDFRQAQ